uniref:Secreted phosphoprotein 1 n=1 Tax=Elaeophora elaphi TaxID=1147741 RepID=A0A0R3RG96_9BILA
MNVLYLTFGTLLLITYCSANCSKTRKLPDTKDATSSQPKKAIVEHSIRLSFHNDLPKSEGSVEHSSKATAKHHSKILFTSPDRTQSGITGPKGLLSAKPAPKLCVEAQNVVGKSLIVASEKLTDDKTQTSAPSVDFTQLTVVSEGNEKQSSNILTESTLKEKNKQTKAKDASKDDKALQEAVTQYISISQVLNAPQSKKKEQSEAEESESTGESIASATEDRRQSSTSSTQSIQPG